MTKSILSQLNNIGEAYSNVLEKESQCFDYISQVEDGLVPLIADFPEQCRNIESNHFSFKMIQFLNQANLDSISIGYGPLLTAQGLGNEKILQESVDNLLAFKEAESPITAEDLVDFVRDILLMQNGITGERELGITSIENGLRLIQFILQDNSFDMKNYLGSLADDFSVVSDQELMDYIQLLGRVLVYYSQYQFTPKAYTEKYSCEDMFKESFRAAPRSGSGPCLNKDQVKDKVKEVLVLFKRKSAGKKTPLELLIEAFSPEYGINVPLLENGKKIYANRHIDIQQSLLYLYDSLKHKNVIKYHYGPDDFIYANATNSEQTEIVIRDSGFYGDYFGLLYLNATTMGADYVKSAKMVTGMFEHFVADCLNDFWCNMFFIPFADGLGHVTGLAGFGKRHLSKLPDYAKYWSLNVVSTSPALVAVGDKYKHDGKYFQHDLFMKIFLSIFVQSSPDEAQFKNPYFSNMSDQYLDVHNGKIVLRLAEASAFTNSARFIYDRFGPDKNYFDKVVFSDEVQRINRNLLSAMKIEPTQKVLMSIFNDYLGSNKELDQVIDNLVDWLASLTYEKQRVVEEVIGDLVVIISSLGQDNDDLDFKTFSDTYAGQSLFNQVSNLDRLLLIVHQLIQHSTHEKFKLFDFFNTVRAPIRFIRDGLSMRRLNFESDSEAIGERRKFFYMFVNESFKVFEVFLVKKLGMNFMDFTLSKVRGSGVESWGLVKNGMSSLGKLLGASGSREKVGKLGEILRFESKRGGFRTNNMRKWVASTFNQIARGEINTEYKKLLDLVNYLLLPARGEEGTKLRSALRQIFITDYHLLGPYIADILALIDNIPPESKRSQ